MIDVPARGLPVTTIGASIAASSIVGSPVTQAATRARLSRYRSTSSRTRHRPTRWSDGLVLDRAHEHVERRSVRVVAEVGAGTQARLVDELVGVESLGRERELGTAFTVEGVADPRGARAGIPAHVTPTYGLTSGRCRRRKRPSRPARSTSSRATAADRGRARHAASIRTSGSGTRASSRSGSPATTPPRAAGELRALFRGQWANGLLPHMIFADDVRDVGSRHIWQSKSHADAPRDVETSCITQPPLPAIAAERVAQALPARRPRRLLAELFPKLVDYHRWLYRERAPDGRGLVTLIHPWECGLDTTPPWIRQLRRMRRPVVAPSRTAAAPVAPRAALPPRHPLRAGGRAAERRRRAADARARAPRAAPRLRPRAHAAGTPRCSSRTSPSTRCSAWRTAASSASPRDLGDTLDADVDRALPPHRGRPRRALGRRPRAVLLARRVVERAHQDADDRDVLPAVAGRRAARSARAARRAARATRRATGRATRCRASRSTRRSSTTTGTGAVRPGSTRTGSIIEGLRIFGERRGRRRAPPRTLDLVERPGSPSTSRRCTGTATAPSEFSWTAALTIDLAIAGD